MQNAILSGRQFELYADCDRLVPEDIRPVPVKEVIDIEKFDPEKMGVGHKKKSIKSTKRKREDDDDKLDRFATGFQLASGRKVGSIDADVIETSSAAGAKLNGQEEATMRKYSMKPSIQSAQPAIQRNQTLPFKRPVSFETAKPAHLRFQSTSTRASALFRVLEAGQTLTSDSDVYQAWEEGVYPYFKNRLVDWWPEANAGNGSDGSFRLARMVPEDRTATQPSCNVRDDIGLLSDEEDDDKPSFGLSATLLDEVDEDELPDIWAGPSSVKKAVQNTSSCSNKKARTHIPSSESKAKTSKAMVVIDLDLEDDDEENHENVDNYHVDGPSSGKAKKVSVLVSVSWSFDIV